MYAGTRVTGPGNVIAAEIIMQGDPVAMFARSDGKRYVAGVPGRAYIIRVYNLTPRRIEAVVSVDGRSVLDDQPADHDRNGLVIPGSNSLTGQLSHYDFAGWRISDQQTGAFVFGAPEASIAAVSGGDPSSIGVIGIAAHRERPSFAKPSYGGGYGSYGGSEILRGGGSKSFSAEGYPAAASATMDMAPAEPALGTGMGDVKEDRVGRTSFTRDQAAPDLLVIGYDTEAHLDAMGLLRPADPDPWPGQGLTGYAKYAQR